MPKIAVFDIGNTSLKFGIADAGHISKVVCLEQVALSPRKLHNAVKGLAREEGLAGAIACSVSPTGKTRTREAWRTVSRIPLLFLNHRMKLPIQLKYPQPATIGPDRLAAASASYARLKRAHIVIDAGTACTIDCVNSKGSFLGGAIAPGPSVMMNYLSSNTGLLPKMEFSGPVPKVGRSTEGAMRIGVRIGYKALLNGIVNHLVKGAFGGQDVPILVTGGYASQASRELVCKSRIAEGLTLEGLALAYDLNM